MPGDALFADVARRAVSEHAAVGGAARLEVFQPSPTDATFVRERNVAPDSDAAPVWSVAGDAQVALTPTSISVRFTPADAAALAQRPPGPARIRAGDGSWEAVKGYGGLPQTKDEVLFDGALLRTRFGTAPVAATRIVFAGAAWSADAEVSGANVVVSALTGKVANHHDQRMALVMGGSPAHADIADLARALGFVNGVETAVVSVERYAADAALIETEHRRWTPRVGWSPHSPFTGIDIPTRARAFAMLATALRASDDGIFPLGRVVDLIVTSYNVRDIHMSAQLLTLAIVTALAHGYDPHLAPADRERYESVRAELLERGYFHDPGYETGRPQRDIKFMRDIAIAIVLRSCGFSGAYYGAELATTLEKELLVAVDMVRTGPGTLAGRFMRRFWQAVHRSEDLLAGQATPVRILGTDFTLYRDEQGVPHAIGFRCSHRGTQLSVGYVEGECIRCFYHGWVFDPRGICVERPAEKARAMPSLNIDGYPTQEYLGLIFVYFGEGEPPPLWRFAAMEREGVRDVTVDVMPSNYFFALENSVLHFSFVHRDLMEEKGLNGIPEITRVEETAFGLAAYSRWPNKADENVSYKLMPNVGYIVPRAINMAKRVSHSIHLSFRVPVDDESHTTFRVTLTPVTGEAAQALLAGRSPSYYDRSTIPQLGDAVIAGKIRLADIEDRTHIEAIQDYVAQVGQGPVSTRDDEHLGSSDVAEAAFRRIWRRELTALEEGKPLKEWRLTEEIEPV